MALSDDIRPLVDEARPLPDAPADLADVPLVAETAAGSMPKAVIAGAVAGLIGALVWGGVTKATSMEIGWIAIGVGFLCGIAVRAFGKGVTPPFRVVAAATAIGGIALGKAFAVLWIVQDHDPEVTFSQVIQFLPQTFGMMDLLFVGIAVWQAWAVAVPADAQS